MRILFATDGSGSAGVARDLMAALPWPAGTEIRVLGVIPATPDLLGAPFIAAVPSNFGEIEARLVRESEAELSAVAATLAAPDRTTGHVLARGRAGSRIVDAAAQWPADLVVVGSRGNGPLTSLLVGSVSAEVVDHAPCPVLVVRTATPGPVLFADDGSAGARSVEAVLAGWPILLGQPVTVLTVAETVTPMLVGVVPGATEEVLRAYDEANDLAVSEGRRHASGAAHRLTREGYDATALVRSGDAAHEILDLAAVGGYGLIVIGTRGRTGLARLIMGSVARKVLTHAPCSVLVVRETVTIRPESAGEIVEATPVAPAARAGV
jgi:nucleotide-binding universal stress UspA family protein